MLSEREQAADHERKLLDKDDQLFTVDELAEAETLRAAIDRVVARAGELNRQVIDRLAQESKGSEAKATLLQRFRTRKGLRIELPPF